MRRPAYLNDEDFDTHRFSDDVCDCDHHSEDHGFRGCNEPDCECSGKWEPDGQE